MNELRDSLSNKDQRIKSERYMLMLTLPQTEKNYSVALIIYWSFSQILSTKTKLNKTKRTTV